MPDFVKSFQVGDQTLDIPLEKVDLFKTKYPEAEEVRRYALGEDTLHIPIGKDDVFKSKYPDAKPLAEYQAYSNKIEQPSNEEISRQREEYIDQAKPSEPIDKNAPDDFKNNLTKEVDKLQSGVTPISQQEYIAPIETLEDADKKTKETLSSIENDIYKDQVEKFKKLHPEEQINENSIGDAISSIQGKVLQAESFGNPKYDKYKSEVSTDQNNVTALTLLDKTQSTLKEIAKAKESGILKNLGKGTASGLGDYFKDYLTLGETLSNNSAISSLKDKFERISNNSGENFTSGEASLIKALQAVEQTAEIIDEELPESLRAGKAIGGSIGFMAEFGLSGGGSAIKTLVAKGAVEGTSKAMKVGLKLAQAGIQTAKMPTLYKETAKKYSLGESPVQAFGNAFYETGVEVVSESLFMGKLGESKNLISKVAKRLGNAVSGQTGVKGIVKGIGQEYVEEKFAEAMTSVKNIAQNKESFDEFASKFVNLKENLRTLAPVAIISGAIGGLQETNRAFTKSLIDSKIKISGDALEPNVKKTVDVIVENKDLTPQETFELITTAVKNEENPKEVLVNATKYATDILTKDAFENVSKEIKSEFEVPEEIKKIVQESDSAEEAFNKVGLMNDIFSDESKTSFRKKYDPERKKTPREAFTEFYNEQKGLNDVKEPENTTDKTEESLPKNENISFDEETKNKINEDALKTSFVSELINRAGNNAPSEETLSRVKANPFEEGKKMAEGMVEYYKEELAKKTSPALIDTYKGFLEEAKKELAEFNEIEQTYSKLSEKVNPEAKKTEKVPDLESQETNKESDLKSIEDNNSQKKQELKSESEKSLPKDDKKADIERRRQEELSTYWNNQLRQLPKSEHANERKKLTENLSKKKDLLNEFLSKVEGKTPEQFNDWINNNEKEAVALVNKMTDADIDKLWLYGSDRSASNKSKIDNALKQFTPEVEKINAKYDAELKALESEEKSEKESPERVVENGEVIPEKVQTFTSAEVINRDYAKLKVKLGEKKAKKYFDQVDRLIDPNKNEIVEYRANGVVTKEDGQYIFRPLTGTSLKNWGLSNVLRTDVSDQFIEKTDNIDKNTDTVSMSEADKAIEDYKKSHPNEFKKDGTQKEQYAKRNGSYKALLDAKSEAEKDGQADSRKSVISERKPTNKDYSDIVSEIEKNGVTDSDGKVYSASNEKDEAVKVMARRLFGVSAGTYNTIEKYKESINIRPDKYKYAQRDLDNETIEALNELISKGFKSWGEVYDFYKKPSEKSAKKPAENLVNSQEISNFTESKVDKMKDEKSDEPITKKYTLDQIKKDLTDNYGYNIKDKTESELRELYKKENGTDEYTELPRNNYKLKVIGKKTVGGGKIRLSQASSMSAIRRNTEKYGEPIVDEKTEELIWTTPEYNLWEMEDTETGKRYSVFGGREVPFYELEQGEAPDYNYIENPKFKNGDIYEVSANPTINEKYGNTTLSNIKKPVKQNTKSVKSKEILDQVKNKTVAEPHEMTRKEYVESIYGEGSMTDSEGGTVLFEKRMTKTLPAAESYFKHEELVKKAIKEGKSVPEEVLKDYPDLQKSVQSKSVFKEGEQEKEVNKDVAEKSIINDQKEVLESIRGTKAVDEKGEPVVVFHGTRSLQEIVKEGELDPTRRGETSQFGDERPYLYFTDEIGNAGHYAGDEYYVSKIAEVDGVLTERDNVVLDAKKKLQGIKGLNEDEKEIFRMASSDIYSNKPIDKVRSFFDRYKGLGLRDEKIQEYISLYESEIERINNASTEPLRNKDVGLIKAYLDIRNPLIVDGNIDHRFKFFSSLSFGDIIDKAEAEGNDGIIIKNTKDPFFGTVYIVSDAKQVKSFGITNKDGIDISEQYEPKTEADGKGETERVDTTISTESGEVGKGGSTGGEKGVRKKEIQERIDKIDSELGDVWSDLADIIGAKKSLTGEQRQRLLPTIEKLVKLYAEKLGLKGEQLISAVIDHLRSKNIDLDKEDEKFIRENTVKEISLKHESTEEMRSELGLEEREKRTGRTDVELNEEAERIIKEGFNVKQLTEDILNNKKQATDLEYVILTKWVAELNDKLSKTDVKSPEFDNTLNEINQTLKAAEGTGSEAGAALGIRARFKTLADETLADFFVTEQKYNQDAPLTEGQKEEFKKQFEELIKSRDEAKKKNQELIEELTRIEASDRFNEVRRSKIKVLSSSERSQKKEELLSILGRNTEYFASKLGVIQTVESVEKPEVVKDLAKAASIVSDLVADSIKRGAKNIDEAISKVFNDLEGKVDKDFIKDSFNEKYSTATHTQNEAQKELFEKKRELKLVEKLDALNRGEVPKTESRKIQRKREMTGLQKQIKEHDLTKLEAYKKRLLRDTEKLSNDLKTGNILKAKDKKPVSLSEIESRYNVNGKLPDHIEDLLKKARVAKDNYNKIKKEIIIRRIHEEYDQKSKIQKAWDNIIRAAGIPRMLKTILDYSAVLRQGGVAAVAHPKIAGKAALEMFKQSVSQKRFDRWFADVKEHDKYEESQEAGLFIADVDNPYLIAHEEAFMGKLTTKYPKLNIVLEPIKGSERAYVGFLNKLRWDIYLQMAEMYESKGKTIDNSPELYKEMAHYINNLTGRGKLGKMLEPYASTASVFLFAPRLYASNIYMLTAYPLWSKSVPKEVKQMYLKDMLKFVGVGMTVLSLAALAGADVEDDPRSSDFGKIRIGNTRWDIWGGKAQYIRVLAQILTGETKATTSGRINKLDGEGAYGRTWWDVGGDFFRYKLAPVPSTFWDFQTGTSAVGEDVTIESEALELITPLIMKDIYEAYKDSGVGLAFGVGITSMFGVGAQTFDDKNRIKKIMEKRRSSKKIQTKAEKLKNKMEKAQDEAHIKSQAEKYGIPYVKP